MKLEYRHFYYLSIIFFLISLTQKTYCTNDNCGDYWSGLICVLVGLLGIFVGGAFLTWFANVFLIISWITYSKKGLQSLIFSIAGFAVGLSFMTFKEIIIDEAGNYGKITGYQFGYWLWIGSMLVISTGNICKLINK